MALTYAQIVIYCVAASNVKVVQTINQNTKYFPSLYKLDVNSKLSSIDQFLKYIITICCILIYLNQVAIHTQQTYIFETVLYVDFSTIVTVDAN